CTHAADGPLPCVTVAATTTDDDLPLSRRAAPASGSRAGHLSADRDAHRSAELDVSRTSRAREFSVVEAAGVCASRALHRRQRYEHHAPPHSAECRRTNHGRGNGWSWRRDHRRIVAVVPWAGLPTGRPHLGAAVV